MLKALNDLNDLLGRVEHQLGELNRSVHDLHSEQISLGFRVENAIERAPPGQYPAG